MRMHAQACVCWSKYTTSEKLNSRLSLVDWTNSAETVQQVCNDFEIKLINVVDLLAPLTEFKDNKPTRKLDPSVKRKLNIRNRLLKLLGSHHAMAFPSANPMGFARVSSDLILVAMFC